MPDYTGVVKVMQFLKVFIFQFIIVRAKCLNDENNCGENRSLSLLVLFDLIATAQVIAIELSEQCKFLILYKRHVCTSTLP